MSVHLKPATLSDAEAMHRMQVEAFAGLLEKYRDFETSPASETVEKIRERISQPHAVFYFIMEGRTAVGGIRVVAPPDPERRKRISPLFIQPGYRGRRLAQQAIAEAERLYGAGHWSLGTIQQEPGNCHLYEKMGYHRTGEATIINDGMTIIGYEKD